VPAIASTRHRKVSQAELVNGIAWHLPRQQLDAFDGPHYDSRSHIVPVMVGDLILRKQVRERLLDEFSG
jgi:hypothetical protein